ncbi:hypothetical protein KR215_002946 [Drosophila sulfurigaster]|nr:hypothetical protein KR215_002946 [Drosophila sulfurigaster]
MENTKFYKYYLSFKVLILVLGVASGRNYRLELENEEIFTTCKKQSANFKDFTDLIDFSELTLQEIGDKVQVSGNATSKWNYDPTDHLEASVTVFRFDRREWQNTLISMVLKDFCKVLYDEQQEWYRDWTKHIVNANDVKDKCLLNGTKLIHETFTVDMILNVPIIGPEGRHKLVIMIKVIDKNQKVRNPILCTEIIGEVFRV